MKLNLGCGNKIKEGFIGIDKIDFGFNKVVDLEKDKLPFEDNSVDYILANHFIEHLKDVKNCLNECWRVLKPDGIIEIIVPHGFWEGAFNPVHFQTITPAWFGFFKREDNWERYGYRVWELIKVKSICNNKGVLYIINALMKPKK